MKPISKKKILLIGAGALGKALGAHLFTNHELTYFSREKSAWQNHKNESIESYGFYLNDEFIKSKLNQADVIFIATQDQFIKTIAQQLAPHLSNNQWLIHGSGSISEAVLHHQKEQIGFKTAVFHVLQTFHSETHLNPNCLNGVSATLLGDKEIVSWLKMESSLLKMNCLEVSEEQKKQVHIAAVFACNFQHVLLDLADKVVQKEGFSAINFLQNLIHTTIHTISEKGAVYSLSGPVKRKDEAVIQQHIKSLSEQPDAQHLYNELTNYLIKRNNEIEIKK